MNPNQLERAAYIAAHAILRADIGSPELACPGARRSRTVDMIAGIIKGVFEIHSSAFDEYVDWWETNHIEPDGSPQNKTLAHSSTRQNDKEAGKIYTLALKKSH